MPRASVAILDLGSNTIKLLVAARGPGGRPVALKMESVDARIGTGLGRSRKPRLRAAAMDRVLAAVQSLLAAAEPFAPKRIVLVATSAVRDASNGPAFCRRIKAVTGQAVRILSGEEEARLIGAGLACDPALAAWRDFCVFDLGGGSLECLSFRRRRLEKAISLPLGCVRLTERFVADPSRPIPAAALRALRAHVKATLAESGFVLPLPRGFRAVGTGGTLVHARSVLAGDSGRGSSVIPAARLRQLLRRVAALSLASRRKVPGLPPPRADVFPAALATFTALAEIGGFASYRQSTYNLRWGLAKELLAGC